MRRSVAQILLAGWLLAGCSVLFSDSLDEQGAAEDSGAFDGAQLDGSPLDARGFEARVSFAVAVLECGLTSIVPSNILVQLDGGGAPSPEVQYQWTLRHDSEVLFVLTGAPGERLTPDARVLGGTFGEPEFNLTMYRDRFVGRVIRNTQSSSVFQSLELSPGSYVMEGVVMTPETSGISFSVRRQGSEATNFGLNTELRCPTTHECDDEFHYARFPFDTNVNLSQPTNALVQLVFWNNKTYFIDDVKLSDADGISMLSPGSFESEDTEVWGSSLGSGSLTAVPVPPSLTRYGEYVLELRALDENGNSSPPHAVSVSHEPCE